MDKIAWTLARPDDTASAAFRSLLLTEVGGRVIDLVPTAMTLAFTLQDEGEHSGALVPVGGDERPVDALLEAVTVDRHVALDAVHDLLRSHCGHVLGWRVKPTLIYDASTEAPVGEPSAYIQATVFIERLDGTPPEHFDRNWYIHAGHLDGQEAASPASEAESAKDLAAIPGARYVQNRIIEPVTPTAWLVHGYPQLLFPFHVPPVDPDVPYERTRGEEPFDRWPPRILQGPEYRLR